MTNATSWGNTDRTAFDAPTASTAESRRWVRPSCTAVSTPIAMLSADDDAEVARRGLAHEPNRGAEEVGELAQRLALAALDDIEPRRTRRVRGVRVFGGEIDDRFVGVRVAHCLGHGTRARANRLESRARATPRSSTPSRFALGVRRVARATHAE